MRFLKSLIAFICLALATSYTLTAQNSSVLNQGSWYKIEVFETGIYKIGFYQLQELGIDPKTIDPKTIKIYGNGGQLLPHKNNIERKDDLYENAIQVVGEEDGFFDDSDFIMFYGDSPNQITFDSTNKQLSHVINPYTISSAYFLTFGDQNGKRITTITNNSTPSSSTNSFLYYHYSERELTNLIQSGQNWVGQFLNDDNREATFTHDISKRTDSILNVKVGLVGTSYSPIDAMILKNGTEITKAKIPSISNGTYGVKGSPYIFETEINVNNSEDDINITAFLPGENIGTSAYVDFFSISYNHSLAFKPNRLFNNLSSPQTANLEYQFTSWNDDRFIWDITNKLDPVNQTVTHGTFTHLNDSSFHQFIMGSISQTPQVDVIYPIENQNLHDIPCPEMLIITHPEFEAKSKEYASLRSSEIENTVVTTDEIYNEYSSGKLDVTAIRNFINSVYKKDPKKLKYILLIGAGSYDYKYITPNNRNYVPIYQSEESYNNINSYSSDDYYGFMNDEDGEWIVNHEMQLAIGRLPVISNDELDIYIQKTKSFLSQQSLGNWKNRMIFCADDDDNNLHMDQSDRLAEKIQNKNPQLIIKKTFLDSFKQTRSLNGEHSPQATKELLNQINQGALIVDYTGHGNNNQWANEDFFTTSSITQLSNHQKLPIFLALTNDYSRADNPTNYSGSQSLLFQSKNGAIATIGSSRPVYSLSNYSYKIKAFDFLNLKDQNLTIGEWSRLTKNNSFSGTRNRNITLFGDPSLKINYPKHKIVIDEIHDENPNDNLLSGEIILRGKITDNLGQLINTYNGNLSTKLILNIDSAITLGNEGYYPFEFIDRSKVLAISTSKIENGEFECSLFIGKSILKDSAQARFSFYAQHNSNLFDATGYLNNIYISNPTHLNNDTIPPTIISIDTSFIFTEDLSTAIITWNMSDESGIKISELDSSYFITATLNDTMNVYLNHQFITEPNDYTTGRITLILDSLEEGYHEIQIKIWDNCNNLKDTTIEIHVANIVGLIDKENITISTSPNPFTEQCMIRANNTSFGTIEILNSTGVLQRTIQNKNSSTELIWYGKDNNGMEVPAGIYYYLIIEKHQKNNRFLTGKIIKM